MVRIDRPTIIANRRRIAKTLDLLRLAVVARLTQGLEPSEKEYL
jgi:hypothetical protein